MKPNLIAVVVFTTTIGLCLAGHLGDKVRQNVNAERSSYSQVQQDDNDEAYLQQDDTEDDDSAEMEQDDDDDGMGELQGDEIYNRLMKSFKKELKRQGDGNVQQNDDSTFLQQDNSDKDLKAEKEQFSPDDKDLIKMIMQEIDKEEAAREQERDMASLQDDGDDEDGSMQQDDGDDEDGSMQQDDGDDEDGSMQQDDGDDGDVSMQQDDGDDGDGSIQQDDGDDEDGSMQQDDGDDEEAELEDYDPAMPKVVMKRKKKAKSMDF